MFPIRFSKFYKTDPEHFILTLINQILLKKLYLKIR